MPALKGVTHLFQLHALQADCQGLLQALWVNAVAVHNVLLGDATGLR